MSTRNEAHWIAVARMAQVVVQFGSLSVFTRMLSPEQYGLMSLAAVVTLFASTFQGLGTGSAFVQRKEIDDDVVSTLLWLNAGIGLGLGVLVAAAAVPSAWFFGTQALIGVLLALSLQFPFFGVAWAFQARLEREQRFREQCFVDVASSLGGAVAGLTVTWAGAGVYGLVTQALTGAVLWTFGLGWICGFRTHGRYRSHRARELLAPGLNISATAVIGYLSSAVDNIAIGRRLGVADVGGYNVANKLTSFPVQHIVMIAHRTLLPRIARADQAEAGRVYSRALRAVCILTAPGMALLAVLREPLITLCFGTAWQTFAGLLLWLAPAGFLQALRGTTNSALIATGRPQLMLCISIFNAAVRVSAILYTVGGGTTSLARGVLLSELIVTPISLWITVRTLKVGLVDLMRELTLRPNLR